MYNVEKSEKDIKNILKSTTRSLNPSCCETSDLDRDVRGSFGSRDESYFVFLTIQVKAHILF